MVVVGAAAARISDIPAERISAFMKVNPVVALRVLEARKAYMKEFDYSLLRECAEDLILSGNVNLMREHMNISMARRGGGAKGMGWACIPAGWLHSHRI